MMPDKKKRTSPIIVRSITLAQLKPLFTIPLAEAAQQLDISETCLKRLCRRLNLEKWPYRELNDVRRTITKIKGLAEGQSAHASALLAGLEQQEQLLLATGRSDAAPVADEAAVPLEEVSDETIDESEESSKHKRHKTPEATPSTTPTMRDSMTSETITALAPDTVTPMVPASEEDTLEAKHVYPFPHPYLYEYPSPSAEMAAMTAALEAQRHDPSVTYPYATLHPSYMSQHPPLQQVQAWLSLTPEQRHRYEMHLQMYYQQLYGYPPAHGGTMPWFPRPPHP